MSVRKTKSGMYIQFSMLNECISELVEKKFAPG